MFDNKINLWHLFRFADEIGDEYLTADEIAERNAALNEALGDVDVAIADRHEAMAAAATLMEEGLSECNNAVQALPLGTR